MLKVANSVINASRITGTLPVANGGTGVTTSTGTGNTVLSAAPTLSGDVTLSTGNLVIGTAGKGIDFSVTGEGTGTMTSELLADYEEGTWTPTLNGFTTSGVVTATGTYRKVGTIMYIRGQIAVSGGTTAAIAGTAYLTNLPFSATAAAGAVTNNAATGIGLGTGVLQGGYLYPSTYVATANTIIVDGTCIVA